MLRKVLHSTLPIEMYHFPDEMQDKALREELEASYDLKLVEVSGKRPNGKSWSKLHPLDQALIEIQDGQPNSKSER